MTHYLALLRGINVGGNSLIKMDALARMFEDMGFSHVKTYIASGNVLFESDEADMEKMEKGIEAEILKTFSHKVRIFIRTDEQMRKTVESFPKIFADTDWKHNVIFLGKELDTPEVVKRFATKEDIETLTYTPWALYWSARKDSLTKAIMTRLASKPEYQAMTVRNPNTVRKLGEMI